MPDLGYTFLAFNLLTFLLFGFDKLKAKNDRWRIPEIILFTCAIYGGALGAWIGMYVWHHKTQHAAFQFGIPILLLLQVAVWMFCFLK